MSVRDRIKMMEQMAKKEEGAADERGRSPGGVSSVRSNASDSPRPLSKVRTSFVAIEKDGRIGLQRQASGDSIISGRKYSGDPELASSILQDHTRTNVSSPESTRPELPRSFGPSTVSPTTIQDAGPTSAPAAGQPAPAPSEPATSPDPAFAGAVDSKPASPQDTAPTGSPTSSQPSSTGPQPGRQEGLAEAAQIRQAPRRQDSKVASVWPPSQVAKESQVQPLFGKAQGKGDGEQCDLNGDSSGPSSSTGEATSDAPAVNGASMAVKASSPSPAAVLQPKPAVKEAEPKALAKPIQPAPKRSATPPATQKAAPETKTPSTVSPAFVKPRPKSPTRPVKLPASLTTHTAASGQRTKSGAPPSAHANRPQSRTSATSSGKPMKRSVSASGRQRPSIGPPPKQIAKDHPVPKKEVKAPDESFLARMMRPTQASASKVADKVHVPTTPPRKVSAAARKPPSAKTGQIRRVASRTMGSTANNTEIGKKDGLSSTKGATKKVEQTPIAEETITMAKRAAKNEPLKPSEGKIDSEESEQAPTSEKHASSGLLINGNENQKVTPQKVPFSTGPTETRQPEQEEW